MSDQKPDSPPRPQYGEYATPEEQKARIRQPDVTESLAAGRMAAPETVPPRTGASAVPTTAEHPVRRFDRIITFALLAYGLVTVITSIPAFADYGTYTDFVFEFMGIDAQLADPAAGRPWGIAAALVLAVGWLATAALSWWSVRRGRLTWWIPVVGGVVSMTVASFLLLVPMMGDQAVWDAIVNTR
jgi:hypothetical protein